MLFRKPFGAFRCLSVLFGAFRCLSVISYTGGELRWGDNDTERQRLTLISHGGIYYYEKVWQLLINFGHGTVPCSVPVAVEPTQAS